MDVIQKKLSAEEAMRLVRVSMDRLKPYELMPAPAYVWMQKNKKFLCIKKPLDFLNAEEFEKAKAWGDLYFPPWIERMQWAQDGGSAVRALMAFHPRSRKGVELQPWSSFERNDGIVRTMASLWGQPLMADPFALCFFVDRVCEPLAPADLQAVREQSVEIYEHALFRSSWAVTLALLLGHGDPLWLSRWRRKVFLGESLQNVDEQDLLGWVAGTLPSTRIRALKAEVFDQAVGRLGERLKSRMQRIRELASATQQPHPTLLEDTGVVFG